jgi:hypothetical protein
MRMAAAREVATGCLPFLFALLLAASCTSSTPVASIDNDGGGEGGAGGGGGANAGGGGGASGQGTICTPCKIEGDCASGLLCLSSPPSPGAPAAQGTYCTSTGCSTSTGCGQAAGNELTCVPYNGYASGGVNQCVCGASALCRFCAGNDECPTGYSCVDHYCTKSCSGSCDSVSGVTVECVNSQCQCGLASDAGADTGGSTNDAGDDASDASPNDAESDGGG